MLSMDEDPEAPTPLQRNLVAEVYRRARRRLRADRLWVLGVLGVALPLKGLLLRWAMRAAPGAGRRVAVGMAVGAIAGVALYYPPWRKR